MWDEETVTRDSGLARRRASERELFFCWASPARIAADPRRQSRSRRRPRHRRQSDAQATARDAGVAGCCTAPRGPRSVLRHLPQRTPADRGTRAGHGEHRAGRRGRGGVGKGRHETAHGGDAAGRPTAPGPGDLRHGSRHGWKPSSTAPTWRDPIRVAPRRSTVSTGPSIRTPSAICSRSTWTFARCCRATMSTSTASTTWRTC